MSILYNKSFSLLPNSLQSLGDNPLELLYKMTSKGLHNLSEQDCLKYADKIHILLDFVIRKIYEENSEILEIRDVIKKLKE